MFWADTASVTTNEQAKAARMCFDACIWMGVVDEGIGGSAGTFEVVMGLDMAVWVNSAGADSPESRVV